MAFKLIDALDAKEGTAIIIEGAPSIVRAIDISKTGKHGASKCRIEAIGIIDNKKRIVAVPGHERFEVPMIEKRRGQILSVSGNIAIIMDSESFENFDVPIGEDSRNEVQEGKQAEYWIVNGVKIIKRIN